MRWRPRPSLPLAVGAVLIALVTVAVVLPNCTGVKNLSFPTPPGTAPGSAETTTAVPPDLTGVSLTPVASAPPTTVTVTPGAASLQGIVTGPLGIVGGATVLVERLVGDSVGAKSVATAADGTWKLPGIKGGRYRIRSWHAPDLSLTTPQVILLGATENQSVTLTLLQYNGTNATATVAPVLAVAQVSTLVVVVTVQTVGPDGVVRATPLPGAAVDVTAAPNIVIAGANPTNSDAGGRVTLRLGCSATGPPGLSATVDSLNTFPLAVPDCLAVPPPTVPPSTVKPPTSSTVP